MGSAKVHNITPPDHVTSTRPKRIRKGALCYVKDFNAAAPAGQWPYKLREAKVTDTFSAGVRVHLKDRGEEIALKHARVMWPVKAAHQEPEVRTPVLSPKHVEAMAEPEPEPEEDSSDDMAEVDAWLDMGAEMVNRMHRVRQQLKADEESISAEIRWLEERREAVREQARKMAQQQKAIVEAQKVLGS